MRAGAKLVSLEKDWKWALAGKRFLWQARDTPGAVDMRIGDAAQKLPTLQVFLCHDLG